MKEERVYYIKRISDILRVRVSKEVATEVMVKAADEGRSYIVKQGKNLWSGARTTTVGVL